MLKVKDKVSSTILSLTQISVRSLGVHIYVYILTLKESFTITESNLQEEPDADPILERQPRF